MGGTVRQETRTRRPEIVSVVVLVRDRPGSEPALLRRHVSRLSVEGPPALVVDVSALTSLSSVTVAALLRARRLYRARGGRLVLHSLRRQPADLLNRCGLGNLFEVTNGESPAGDVATSSTPKRPNTAPQIRLDGGQPIP